MLHEKTFPGHASLTNEEKLNLIPQKPCLLNLQSVQDKFREPRRPDQSPSMSIANTSNRVELLPPIIKPLTPLYMVVARPLTTAIKLATIASHASFNNRMTPSFHPILKLPNGGHADGSRQLLRGKNILYLNKILFCDKTILQPPL